MKSLKTLTATLLLCAIGATSNADVVVHITGSTAFRAATSNAIKNMLSNVTFAYDGTSFTGATHQIIKGTLPGVSGTTSFKTSWSGSVAGVRDVVQANSIAFMDDTNSVTAGGNNISSPSLNESAAPDIAMSDTYQNSTKYTSPTLLDSVVGIVPFAWVASKDAPSGLTNITPQLARALFKGGLSSAALFTNNTADEQRTDGVVNAGGTMVYAIGRDPFSGTRLTAFAESGIGVFTNVFQYARGIL